MGRTLETFTQKIDRIRSEWSLFRRALRREDQILLDTLFDHARLHAQASSYASPPDPFPAILLSVLIEERKARLAQEERIRALEQRLR
jgi:acyl carrier protein phosphodiesterase